LAIKFVDGLEFDVKGKFRVVEVFSVSLVGLEDGQIEVGNWNVNLWPLGIVEEEGRLKANRVVLDELDDFGSDGFKDGRKGISHCLFLHGRVTIIL
jgi:hypothetical protein